VTKLATVDIKGKKYVTVNERLKYFRESHKGYSLETEIVEITEEFAILRAIIRDDKDRLLATGVAREVRNDSASFVNKTSYVENCETSAWGRALANFGIGIDETVASADEVANAIAGGKNDSPVLVVNTKFGTVDEVKPKKREEVDKASTGDVVRIAQLCKDTKTAIPQLYGHFGVVNVPTKEQAVKIIAALEKKLSDQLDAAAQA
jgi:hypothetical protein